MNKKIILLVAIIIIIILTVFFVWRQNSNRKYEGYFPPEPTQQERENAKKLPKDQCPCWDEGNGVCLPQADCI